jgi:hypothetical protein
MTAQPAVWDHGPVEEGEAHEVELNHAASLVVALVAGVGLVLCSRTSAVALLAAVAVLQAALAFGWVFGVGQPGRIGGLIIAALASGGADVAVSLYPHGRLGTLLIVCALTVPVMFVHQLTRGAARVRIVESVGGIALLVLAVVGLTALVQLRHEFTVSTTGGRAAAGVAAVLTGALVVGHLVDLVLPAPRFDAAVPRGLLAVIASAGLGGSIGHLMLGSQAEFASGRGAFVGAALGALVALVAVGVAFIQAAPSMPEGTTAGRLRAVLGALLPLAVLSPVAFLLCLAVRS